MDLSNSKTQVSEKNFVNAILNLQQWQFCKLLKRIYDVANVK